MNPRIIALTLCLAASLTESGATASQGNVRSNSRDAVECEARALRHAVAEGAPTGETTPGDRIDYFSAAKRRDAFGMSSPFTADGRFNEAVAPDVLYAWMSPENQGKIFATATPDLLLKEIGRPYFLWRTPMGSFAYGTASVRFKLKTGVKFALVPHLHQSDPGYLEKFRARQREHNLGNTVFVSEIPSAGYHEYSIFNGGPIHSISTGTSEHLSEMSGEANWIYMHEDPRNFDLIFKIPDPQDTLANSKTGTTPQIHFDLRNWDKRGLRSRLEDMENQVSKNPNGTILYSSDVAPNRADHFMSKLRSYWLGK